MRGRDHYIFVRSLQRNNTAMNDFFAKKATYKINERTGSAERTNTISTLLLLLAVYVSIYCPETLYCVVELDWPFGQAA